MQETTVLGLEAYYAENADSHGWGPNLDGVTSERRSILDNFVIGRRVLDIGCAHGLYVDYLSLCGMKAAGLDLTASLLLKTRELGRRGDFFRGDATRLPFADKSFETVLLFDVLEHLEDESGMIAEMLRVAARRLLIIVPRRSEDFLVKHNLVYSHHLDRTHLRTYTQEGVRALFPDAGVRIFPVNRDSLKHAMLDAIEAPVLRLLLRIALRPVAVRVYTELLAVVDI